MEKRNFQIMMENQIKNIEGKPRLLLHSCCAPCSSAVLEILVKKFEVTLFFYNPNISPEAEFLKRAEEQKRLLNEAGYDIKIVIPPYDENEFFDAVSGLEKEAEGGARCSVCFRLRLEKCAEYARENGFDFFTTTLSVSPHKNAQILNSICEELSEKYGVSNLYADFKKKNGYKRSCELSEKYGLYRQDYCGCIFSVRG